MKILLCVFVFLLALTTQSPAANITNFGAIPNDGLSDANAFRDALRAVEHGCGGEIVIPKGEFLIDQSIATDFYGGCGYVHLTIRGEVGAELRISVGAGNPALIMSTLKSLQIKDIVFLGVPAPSTSPQFTDAGTIIQVHTIDTVELSHLNFYGIAVDGAIIKVFNANLRVRDSQFAGSAAYFPNGAYLLGDNDGFGNAWYSIKAENCQFIDYANYKSEWITKTPYALTGSYIRTKAPATSVAAMSRGRLEVRDTIFDEGAHTSITADNTPFVDLKGVSINMNNTSGATGIRLTGVKYAVIDQSVADWQPGYFLTTKSVDYVKVNALEFKAGSAFWRNLGKTNMVIDYCPACTLNNPPASAKQQKSAK